MRREESLSLGIGYVRGRGKTRKNPEREQTQLRVLKYICDCLSQTVKPDERKEKGDLSYKVPLHYNPNSFEESQEEGKKTYRG